MGSTCYAITILDSLFPFPELWDIPAHCPLHQAIKAILMIMNVQRRDPSKTTPLWPTIFLAALENYISMLMKSRQCVLHTQ